MVTSAAAEDDRTRVIRSWPRQKKLTWPAAERRSTSVTGVSQGRHASWYRVVRRSCTIPRTCFTDSRHRWRSCSQWWLATAIHSATINGEHNGYLRRSWTVSENVIKTWLSRFTTCSLSSHFTRAQTDICQLTQVETLTGADSTHRPAAFQPTAKRQYRNHNSMTQGRWNVLWDRPDSTCCCCWTTWWRFDEWQYALTTE